MEILPSGLKIVMTLENYKNGKLGLRSVYYPSGKIAEEISYLNNMKKRSLQGFSEWNYT
jgi:antitoxin component YwqK of YwqJK toxin-antitoxin module